MVPTNANNLFKVPSFIRGLSDLQYRFHPTRRSRSSQALPRRGDWWWCVDQVLNPANHGENKGLKRKRMLRVMGLYPSVLRSRLSVKIGPKHFKFQGNRGRKLPTNHQPTQRGLAFRCNRYTLRCFGCASPPAATVSAGVRCANDVKGFRGLTCSWYITSNWRGGPWAKDKSTNPYFHLVQSSCNANAK